MLAVVAKHVQLVQRMLESINGIDIEADDADDDPRGRDTALSILMYEHGADVNARDNEGNTPLMVACTRGRSVRAVTTLLEADDVDLTVVNGQGHTALTLAVCRPVEEAEVVAILAEELVPRCPMAVLNHVDQGGHTALTRACKVGHADAVEHLLERQAGLDVLHAAEGHHALSWACLGGRLDVIIALAAAITRYMGDSMMKYMQGIDKALRQSRVQELASFLRTMFPAMESAMPGLSLTLASTLPMDVEQVEGIPGVTPQVLQIIEDKNVLQLLVFTGAALGVFPHHVHLDQDQDQDRAGAGHSSGGAAGAASSSNGATGNSNSDQT